MIHFLSLTEFLMSAVIYGYLKIETSLRLRPLEQSVMIKIVIGSLHFGTTLMVRMQDLTANWILHYYIRAYREKSCYRLYFPLGMVVTLIPMLAITSEFIVLTLYTTNYTGIGRNSKI